jgi:hypothetical protein
VDKSQKCPFTLYLGCVRVLCVIMRTYGWNYLIKLKLSRQSYGGTRNFTYKIVNNAVSLKTSDIK